MQDHSSPWRTALLCVLLFGLLTGPLAARAIFDSKTSPSDQLKPSGTMAEVPNIQWDVHNIGKIALIITNSGNFGRGYVSNNVIDGETIEGCEFPKNSNVDYLFAGSIWVGAVIGSDTLVSVGADGWGGGREMFPDAGPEGAIISRSNIKSAANFSEDAISEQDFISTYTDTFTSPALTGDQDVVDQRPHHPLNVSVAQNTYAWSYEYAEDFVLMDFHITNIGQFPIQRMYMGIYVDADVYHRSIEGSGYNDDICGFRHTQPIEETPCRTLDTVNIAWIADNDGDPNEAGQYTLSSPIGATGSRVVRTPNADLQYRFNWWISNGNASNDFGPRLQGSPEDPFKPFVFGQLGTPMGDIYKYYVMAHEEFDYDQLFSAISHTGEGFLSPPEAVRACDFADGFDTRYLLSFGPFDSVQPGDTLPITIAYLAGDSLHHDPDAFRTLFDCANPKPYYDQLDFSDFGENSKWADWIFDNPGVDTDSNGTAGEYYYYCRKGDDYECFYNMEPPDSVATDWTCEKVYTSGDGVPDFRGASPPPPPALRVTPGPGRVVLRWNGQESEEFEDPFSRLKDFEGYRVYFAQGDRESDYIMTATYDLNDYQVYELQYFIDTVYWERTGPPLTLDSLRTLFGSDLDPNEHYNEFHAFRDPDADPGNYPSGRFLYFVPQDWNQSNLTDPNGIYKRYPRASRADASDTTEEGYQRYYEYEYVLDGLQPSVEYNFSVTAFDYGSLRVELGTLESSPLINAVSEYPLTDAETVEAEGMEVIVYPNPYRIDAGYATAGYENRDRTLSAERARKINFANLPKVCTIRIYSIDGDLIKEIYHNNPDGGPGSQHETWDVISRNTQAVVTGIYIWQVESEMGNQIGKLVIIK